MINPDQNWFDDDTFQFYFKKIDFTFSQYRMQTANVILRSSSR